MPAPKSFFYGVLLGFARAVYCLWTATAIDPPYTAEVCYRTGSMMRFKDGNLQQYWCKMKP